MGKGLALQFKRAFPAAFTAYATACADGRVRPGEVLPVPIDDGRWILHFPTKRHWRSRSRLDDIEAGLDDLVRVLADLKIVSVAVPPLGCGHGGLDWGVVHPLITAALGSSDVDMDVDVDVRLRVSRAVRRLECRGRPAASARPPGRARFPGRPQAPWPR
ncbi:macro domain-containing protein [Actinomadura soli]|uniref:Macro domain-containing protein n=2 Tax=Actinomadura soli TaxID=2508997 RepID=A0A5C4J6J2_9ACTN|nr:macro domain-containing protein [Actinomadura soli]